MESAAGPSRKAPAKRKQRTFAEIAWDHVQPEDGRFLCNIEPLSSCRLSQKTYDSGNFVRHFRTMHPEAALSFGLIDDSGKAPKKKARVVTKRMVAIDKQQYMEGCVRLIKDHNLPLKCFEWKGLRLFIDPEAEALGLSQDRRNIKPVLHKITEASVKYIVEEMKGQLISIKVDSAQRHHRHILGVNAQYELKNKLVIRTLGMLEVTESQTAKHLMAKILDVLKRYDISIAQIHSITTDNGANMLAAAKHLRQLFTVEMLEEHDAYDEFPLELEAELSEQFNIVRCSVHTLQLALNDVVKNTDPNIKNITDFVKSLKKIKYTKYLDSHKVKTPPIWCPTRWGGKYKMIRKIIKQESFFSKIHEHYPELILTEEDWSFMKEYETAFRPLHKMTKLLQSQHQVFSEFYMQWILALKKVDELEDNRFSKPLHESLTTRLQMLRNSMVFKAALYLDPRFNYLESTFFTPEEKIEVQNYILNVWRRMQSLNGSQKQNESSEADNPSDEDQDISDYLTGLYGGKLECNTEPTNETDILKQLKLLEIEPRQKHNFDVWNYWLARKSTHPQLASVALVIMATPSSQVSVERSFSALPLVLSDHRSCLSDTTLEDILILKHNEDVFEKVFPNAYDWRTF